MGVNKVDLSTGENLFDISQDTVTPETLAKGVTAHDASGEPIVGTMTAEGGGVSYESGIFWVQVDVNPTTYEFSNPSASATEVIDAQKSGKIVKMFAVIKQSSGERRMFGEMLEWASVPNLIDMVSFATYYIDTNNILFFIRAQLQTSPTAGAGTGIVTNIRILNSTNP